MSGPIFLILRLFLAVSLYIFLGWVLITLWREVKYQGTLLAARRTPPIHLLIQRENKPPQMRHFSIPQVTLGRDPGCDCPLEDDTVSGLHARLSYHHNQWWLEDLQSTNGTRLNNEKVTTPTVIISGDEIHCGNSLLTVSLFTETFNPPTRPQEAEK